MTPAELRKRFLPAFKPKAWVFYIDFLASAAIAWTSAIGSYVLGPTSPGYWCLLPIAIVATLRAVYFIHDISHLRLCREEVPGFEIVWSLIAGFPALLPSLMADAHKYHHQHATYGTTRDPEYLPLAHLPRWRVFGSVLVILLVPLLLILRWGIIGPLSWLVPPLRRITIRHLSTLVVNPEYQRPLPDDKDRIRWFVQEWASTFVVWSVGLLIITNVLQWTVVVHWHIIAAGALAINQIRTLVAHAYENLDDQPMQGYAQVADTITLNGSLWLTELAAPLGLRFHALHHMFPSLPYHSLGAVHREVGQLMPQETAYENTNRRGLWDALQRLWGRPSA